MSSPVTRPRNRRGEGARLREEILAAASRLLERTGRDDGVTLRAVAREAGISAPSIYGHFADRDQVMVAVISQTFAELTAALAPVAEAEADPVGRLRALCHAYLDFAVRRPHHYRVLFQRTRTRPPDVLPDHDTSTMVGADAFAVLQSAVQACIDAGASTATSASEATTRLWVSVHGLATLRASMPFFPWPDQDQLLDQIVDRLVDLTTSRRR